MKKKVLNHKTQHQFTEQINTKSSGSQTLVPAVQEPPVTTV